MANIYFVDRDNGDDTKDGKSLANAWKTINKACQTMQAGDTTYVKPTVYRMWGSTSLGTFANSGADGSPISLIGDIDGEYWGIKGYPRLTDKNTDESEYIDASHNFLLFDNKNYITIKGLFIDAFSDGTGQIYIFKDAGTNCIFENNIVYSANIKQTNNSYVFYKSSESHLQNSIVRNNIFVSGQRIANDRSYLFYFNYASTNFNCRIENNIILGFNRPIYFLKSAYPCYINNNFFGERISEFTIYITGATDWQNQLYIYNNFVGCTGSYFVYGNGTQTNIMSGNNYGSGNIANYNATVAIERKFTPYELLLPKLPLENLFYVKDLGNSTYKTDNDILGNPRPLGANFDVGPIEMSDEPIQESTEKESGSYSAKLVKAEFKDFTTFLSAGEHTISVKVKWSDYAGENKPQLIVKQDKYCGIDSDQIATATGDGTEWETLSKTITLSKDAEIVIRVYSRDIGANALTYFDSLNIT